MKQDLPTGVYPLPTWKASALGQVSSALLVPVAAKIFLTLDPAQRVRNYLTFLLLPTPTIMEVIFRLIKSKLEVHPLVRQPLKTLF